MPPRNLRLLAPKNTQILSNGKDLSSSREDLEHLLSALEYGVAPCDNVTDIAAAHGIIDQLETTLTAVQKLYIFKGGQGSQLLR